MALKLSSFSHVSLALAHLFHGVVCFSTSFYFVFAFAHSIFQRFLKESLFGSAPVVLVSGENCCGLAQALVQRQLDCHCDVSGRR